MVLLTTFPSSVKTLEMERRARRCAWSKKDNNNLLKAFKASALPSGFISHTFELSQRDTLLKFQIFLQAA